MRRGAGSSAGASRTGPRAHPERRPEAHRHGGGPPRPSPSRATSRRRPQRRQRINGGAEASFVPRVDRCLVLGVPYDVRKPPHQLAGDTPVVLRREVRRVEERDIDVPVSGRNPVAVEVVPHDVSNDPSGYRPMGRVDVCHGVEDSHELLVGSQDLAERFFLPTTTHGPVVPDDSRGVRRIRSATVSRGASDADYVRGPPGSDPDACVAVSVRAPLPGPAPGAVDSGVPLSTAPVRGWASRATARCGSQS